MTQRPGNQLFDAYFTARDMREVFCDQGRVQAMLDFEAALARAEARVGLIPASAVAPIAAACDAGLYDFAALGVPGLKASVAYLRGDDIRNKSGSGTYNEWERDARIDYTLQEGALKGLGFSLRQGVYRGAGESSADQDQARFIVNYTYSFL